jgi:hypothetical protein
MCPRIDATVVHCTIDAKIYLRPFIGGCWGLRYLSPSNCSVQYCSTRGQYSGKARCCENNCQLLCAHLERSADSLVMVDELLILCCCWVQLYDKAPGSIDQSPTVGS